MEDVRQLRGGGGGSKASSDTGDLNKNIVFRNITAEVNEWNEEFLDNMLIVSKLYQPVIGIIIFSFFIYATSLSYMRYQDYQNAKVKEADG